MLECVVNVSEGRATPALAAIASVAGDALLDLHRDEHHNRAVLTLAGPHLEDAVRAVATAAVERLDLRVHEGAHPRIGVLDVVPFVPLDDQPMATAIDARDRFASWAGPHLQLPCFVYGPERTLPQLRADAFVRLAPDAGPPNPHPTAGACAVGARRVLVAYNLWLQQPDLRAARSIATRLRSPEVRALGLRVGDHVQVSCNLVAPDRVGPAAVYDRVAVEAAVARAELVGLVPRAVLDAVPPARWRQLDLDDDRTIEARLRR